jgi:hypothetical protein
MEMSCDWEHDDTVNPLMQEIICGDEEYFNQNVSLDKICLVFN